MIFYHSINLNLNENTENGDELLLAFSVSWWIERYCPVTTIRVLHSSAEINSYPRYELLQAFDKNCVTAWIKGSFWDCHLGARYEGHKKYFCIPRKSATANSEGLLA